MSKFEGGMVQIELIQELRTLAGHGADIPELVAVLLQRLELVAPNGVIPAIYYFRAAFKLSLREALPLREWIGGQDRSEIDSVLIPAMQRTKDHWARQEVMQA